MSRRVRPSLVVVVAHRQRPRIARNEKRQKAQRSNAQESLIKYRVERFSGKRGAPKVDDARRIDQLKPGEKEAGQAARSRASGADQLNPKNRAGGRRAATTCYSTWSV